MRPVRARRGVELLACMIAVACSACDHADQAPIDEPPVPRVCPTHLDLELNGSQSRFDPGSTGTTHGVGLATGSKLSVEITDCDQDCRRCRFHGPVRGDPAVTPVISQRCLNNVSKICADDAECGGAGPCRHMFPPITSQLVVPTCSVVYFEPVVGSDPSPVQGTSDLLTGETDLPVMNLHVQTTVNACVNCINDKFSFDGVRGGMCGTASGAACDVNGIGAGVTSYDCAPPPNQNLNIELPISGTSTASRKWTLDGTRPPCTKGGSRTLEPCFCGVCSNGKVCIADRDCAAGTGPCGFPGTTTAQVNVSNNSCTGTCVWTEATQRGHCSEDATRSCFPDGALGQSLTARGGVELGDGFFIAKLANLVCLPAFKNALIDPAGGFPGPLLVEAQFRISPRTVGP